MARENLNSEEPPRSTVMCHRERKSALPPAGASRPNHLIGDERPRLEAEITVYLV
jgi:hypothetical protein